MSRKKEAVIMGIGVLAGLALSGPAVQASTALTAALSTQPIYVDGQRASMTAYSIGGNNYVRLRDIGKAVDFGVTYDAATNSVHIDPNSPYIEEVKPPAPSTPAPSGVTEESVRAAILALRDIYPTGALYGAPYVPNDPFDRPFSNCDACAGWAMKCSDAAFGRLPYRQIPNPAWDTIRAGDLIRFDTASSGHAVVVLERTAEYIKVTESGTNNKALWGGQYFKWWLEQQPNLTLYTRYPK